MSTTITSTSPTSAGISTTIIIIQTVTAAASAGPQHPPYKDPLFLDDFWGCLCMFNVFLVLLGTWTALIVGFTRLSVIPIAVSAGAAVGNGLLFIQKRDTGRGQIVWRAAPYVIRNIGWTIQHFVAALYAYFMLKHLLSGSRKRTVYILGFWFLWVVAMTANMCCVVYYALGSEKSGSEKYISAEKKTAPASFLTLAGVELFSASFLLHTFYIGRRNAVRVASAAGGSRKRLESLLTWLAKSTEIRVSCIAVVGIIRCFTCWTWFAAPGTARDVQYQIDDFAVLLENVYPMLLIIDLLAARMSGNSANYTPGKRGFPAERAAAAEQPTQSPETTAADSTTDDSRGQPQTVDSIRRDFRQYIGSLMPAFSLLRSTNIETIDEVVREHDTDTKSSEKSKSAVKDVGIFPASTKGDDIV